MMLGSIADMSTGVLMDPIVLQAQADALAAQAPKTASMLPLLLLVAAAGAGYWWYTKKGGFTL